MEAETVNADKPIIIGEITLLPIVRTLVRCGNSNRGIVFSGRKDFAGIVVISPTSKYAINADGEEMPFDQYVEQVPEVKELLATL